MKKVFLLILFAGWLVMPLTWAAEEMDQAEATADLLADDGAGLIGPVVEVEPPVVPSAALRPASPVKKVQVSPQVSVPEQVAAPQAVLPKVVAPQAVVTERNAVSAAVSPQVLTTVDTPVVAEALIIPSVDGARVVKVPGLGLEPAKAETLQELQRGAIEYSKPEPMLTAEQVDATLGVAVAEETKKETVVELVEKKRAELVEATGDIVGAPLPPTKGELGMPGVGEAEAAAFVEKSLLEKPLGAVEPESADDVLPPPAAPAPVKQPMPAAPAVTAPLAVVPPAAPLAVAPAPAGDVIPFRVVPADSYASFVKNWGNDEEPYYAVIRTPEQWDGAFAPAAVMGNERPFTPPPAFFEREQMLVVARVVPSGGEGSSLAAKSLQRTGDGQEFVYTYTPPQPAAGGEAPYLKKDVLLVAAPKDLTGPFYFVEETLEGNNQ